MLKWYLDSVLNFVPSTGCREKDFSLTKNRGVKLHYMSERSHALEHRMNAELILSLSRILLPMLQSHYFILLHSDFING